MKKNLAIVVLILIFFNHVFCHFSTADVIKLKNGRMIEGEIINEMDDSILVDIGIGEVKVDRGDIEYINFPHEGSVSKIVSEVGRINSHYYSLIDEGVESIKFDFKLSDKEGIVERLRLRGRMETASDIAKMNIVVICAPERDKVDISVLNKPLFDDVSLNEFVSEYTKSAEMLMQNFWSIWRPFVTRLIDTENDEVQSIAPFEDSIIVELVDKEGDNVTLFFDSVCKLDSWEEKSGSGDSCSWGIVKFLDHDSKYLVDSIYIEESIPVGRFVFTYQSVKGIQFPAKIDFQSESPNLPSIIMYFEDVEVNLKRY